MKAKDHIDVCVLTYKRPGLLDKTLSSIGRLNLENIAIRIIVIDNDLNATAQNVVEDFAKINKFNVTYVVEPIQNISMARNRAIEHVQGEYFAFIDDDEIASPSWLMDLLKTLKKYNADVVFGPVKSIFPESAPKWVKTHPVFNRPHRCTGEIVRYGGAGNVLICREIIFRTKVKFDLCFGKSGAEDTDFFFRLLNFNGKAVWCSDAVVYESVGESRLNKKWVLRRCYFGGFNFVRVVVKSKSVSNQIIWGFKKYLTLLFLISLLPIGIFSYSMYIMILSKIYATLGHLIALHTTSVVPAQY